VQSYLTSERLKKKHASAQLT